MNILERVYLLQCQIDLVRLQIECAELKEYDMSWLPGGKKVTRDGGTGKFASKSPSPASDVGREKLTGAINTMASNLKLSGDILAAKVKQSIKNPGVAGRVDAAFNKGDIRGLKAADWKSLAEESGKLFKDAFALEYRQRVEPFLRQKGKDSVGAKVEDFLDKSLQRLNVIEKSFTDQLGEAATEAFDFKKVLQNVAAGACITAAIAGVAAMAAPAIAIPILLSAPQAVIEAATLQPIVESLVKGGLRFEGVDNKLLEGVLSFVAAAGVSSRFAAISKAMGKIASKISNAGQVSESIGKNASKAEQEFVQKVSEGTGTAAAKAKQDIEMPSLDKIRETCKKVGEGAMGEVFKHPTLDIAYKLVKEDVSKFMKFDLQAELKLTTLAGDLGVGPRVLASHEQGYAMEFLSDYKPLAQTLGGKDDKQLLETAEKVVDQLEKLHQKDIAHCDIHAANVMVSSSDEVRIIDYGVATDKFENPDFRILDLRLDCSMLLDTMLSERMFRNLSKEVDEMLKGSLAADLPKRTRSDIRHKIFDQIRIIMGDDGLKNVYPHATADTVSSMKFLKQNLGKILTEQYKEKLLDFARKSVATEVKKPTYDQWRLQLSKPPSLLELLKERKHLRRLQREKYSQKRDAEIQEIDLQIMMLDESLSTEDAYGLMAD